MIPVYKHYQITIKSNSYAAVYKTYAKFRFFLANTKNFLSKPIITKTKKRVTLLKSPHVNKKSREQYQIFTFRKSFEFKATNSKLVLHLIQKISKKEKNRVSITITHNTNI